MNCREALQVAPLHAAGDLDAVTAAAYTAHLETCPDCPQKIERDAYFAARLREIVLSEDVDAEAVNRRVRLQIAAESGKRVPASEPRRSRRWVSVAAGIAAALLLFALGYRDLLGRHIPAVYAAAATDHRLEVVEQARRTWFDNPAQIEALAQQEGVPMQAVVALASGAYHFEHARLCYLDGRIYLHLVFSSDGHELSVYLRQREAQSLPGRAREIDNGRALHAADAGHEHVASFQTDQLTAMVVSDQSADAALQFARFASTVI